METINAVEIHTPSSGKPQVAANTAVTPMEMLDRALSSGADVETLTKLMALQERWEANQARKAFDAAIAEAKAKIPPIVRNATGHNNKRYADFAAIASVVDPILSEHGLSYRFKTAQTDKINVTCVLSHKDGHSEETTLSGGADTSGNKNAIQAIGSTLTYLQRYSLTAALGLAASSDDDGNAAGKQDEKFISDKQVMEIRDLIIEMGVDEKKFCQIGKVDRLEDIPAANYQNAVNILKRKGKAA
ncbi:ERF family protein [Agrobacterium leguminum]